MGLAECCLFPNTECIFKQNGPHPTHTHSGYYGFREEGGALIIPAPHYFSKMELEYWDRQGESKNMPQQRKGLSLTNAKGDSSREEAFLQTL